MTVEKLIEEYEWSKRKKHEYDFSKHIKRKYLPYVEKCALVKGVVESTSYEEVDGIKLYKRNTKGMLFIFTMKIIENYTDLELNIPEITKDYDALMDAGAMNLLMVQIPEEEISILRGMVDMERDDLEINTRSLISFFETKSEVLMKMMDGFLSALENPSLQEKKRNK